MDTASFKVRTFKPCEVVYSPFTKAKEVFVITKGYVMALTYDDEGRRHIHLIYGPGAYFPVITAFKDKPQRATYEALSEVEVELYKKDTFLQLIDQDLPFCRRILLKTVDQVGIFADRVVELQTAKLEDRLLARLKVLIKDHGVTGANGSHLPYKLSHQHLADLLGVERESITRAFNRLQKKGIVARNREDIVFIYDPS